MNGMGKGSALALGVLMVLATMPMAMPQASTRGSSAEGPAGARADAWFTSDVYEQDVEIAAGDRFFLAVGPDGNITPMDVAAPDAGMPPEIMSALDKVPQWIRANLTKKFAELAAEDINAPVLAFADMDRDGDKDLFASDSSSYLEGFIYYRNIGNSYRSVFNNTWAVPIANTTGAEPAAGDLTGDVRPELVLGLDDGSVRIVEFKNDIVSGEDFGGLDIRIASSISVQGNACPTMGDMDADGDLDMVVGDGLGKVQYFENIGDRTNWSFQKTANSLLFAPLVVPGPARPALVDLDGDGDMDIAVGAGNGIVHYFQNIGTRTIPAWAPDNLLTFSGIKAVSDAAPTFTRFDGDNRTDLVLGQGLRPALIYENAGSISSPQWPTWPFYEYTPSIGYYDPHTYLTHLDFNGPVSAYAKAIVGAEPRIVDELAFSIANSAVEALRASSPALYLENARTLYENDQYIDYAQIVDYADYSTIKYTVNQSGKWDSYELPREIYYWYVVHPKITDDMPMYIDPYQPSGSPNESAPPPTGKFWRNFIFFNADASYPPDPPTDLNGDGTPDFHYPSTMSPPVLRDLLAGVKTMWNCTPYNSPGGFDNAGVNNSHPFDYGDHAIEKVSNWVMKTLPLNERESGDGERPIQPVRLWAHHNGNCGELGDLTVAAARAAMIPAVQISLLAEDHVWIQFYDRGWHQWDNYWSDGGAVVDYFMNYWVGWGLRGGSGISAWRGDDHEDEVTAVYVPPPSQSHVTVNVRDAAGYPVDGARVVMMSHWMAESQQQQQEVISYPFPALWNFTDPEGATTFVLAHNNFTIDVVSKLGHSAVNKTYIGTGEFRVFNITLPGRLPTPVPRSGNLPQDNSGRTVHADINVAGGEQRPPNPEVGTTSVQPIGTGLKFDVLFMDRDNFTKYISGLTADMYLPFMSTEVPAAAAISPNGTWYVVISNERTLETSLKVHLKLDVYTQHHPPSVVIEYPANGTIVDAARPIPATGTVTGGSAVDILTMSVDGGQRQNITAGLDRATGRWRWDTSLGAFPSGKHTLTVSVVDRMGLANSSSVVFDTDKLPPSVFIDSPPGGAVLEIGSVLDFRGRASDDAGIRSLEYRLDGGPRTDITGSLSGQGWAFTVAGGILGGGDHGLEVRAVDPVGKSSTATVSFELRDSVVPELAFTAPGNDESFEVGTTIRVTGTARDDSGIATLLLSAGGRGIDILPFLGTSGDWSHSIDTAGMDPGELSLAVTATDGVGNRASSGRNVRLVDTVPPAVTILTPIDGASATTGDSLNVTGNASDDLGLARLEVRAPQGVWRSMLGSLHNGSYRYLLDLTGLAAGPCNISVRATDLSGNTASTSVFINIILQEKSRPRPAKSTAFIPGMEAVAALGAFAVGMLAVFRRRGGGPA